jgi:hypothetical protein
MLLPSKRNIYLEMRPARTFKSLILVLATVVALVWVLRVVFPRTVVGLVLGMPALLEVSPSCSMTCAGQAGGVAVGEYEIKNVSDSTVRILGSTTDCSCTKVTDQLPEDLAVGCTCKIHVRVDIGFSHTGTFTRRTNLLVNRGGYVPTLSLTVLLPAK